jgi:hypothetical protein
LLNVLIIAGEVYTFSKSELDRRSTLFESLNLMRILRDREKTGG